LFGLAFTACSYLAGFTGQALSMSDAVVFARLGTDALDERRALVLRAFRYSLLLAAPGLAVAAVAGAPIVQALLPADSSGSDSYFGTYVLLLAPWLIATIGVWATMPPLLVHVRGLRGWPMVAAVAGLIAIHIAAVLTGRVIAGFGGLVLATAVAPAAFVVIGLRIAAPATASHLVRPMLTISALAVLSFGLAGLLVWAVAGSSPAAGIVAGLMGGTGYVVLAGLAFPDAVRTFVGVVGRG
jgi:hypothetical protein